MTTSAPRILFVEDDKIDQMGFERYLKQNRLPYRYQMVDSLQSARTELFESEIDYDIILTDFLLSDGTGIELISEEVNLPVIVITGAGDEEKDTV